MTIRCRGCGGPIPPEDGSLAKDAALCRRCGASAAVASMPGAAGGATAPVVSPGAAEAPARVDPRSPPEGAWWTNEGVCVRIGARLRSPASGAILVFAVLWNAVLTIITLGAAFAGGDAGGLHLPELLFLSVFWVIGGAAGVLGVAARVGRAEVTLRGVEGVVEVGAGPVTWRRRFDVAAVVGVQIAPANARVNNRPVHQVLLAGPNVRFGGLLTAERREFVAGALRMALKV